MMGWTEDDTQYCLNHMSRWRSSGFRVQEDLIIEMMANRKLSCNEDGVRLHMNYLDKLTNDDFSSYELLTIPEKDKHLLGTCKK